MDAALYVSKARAVCHLILSLVRCCWPPSGLLIRPWPVGCFWFWLGMRFEWDMTDYSSILC